MGEYAEAERILKQVVEIQRHILGPESGYTVASTYNLACVVTRRGRRDEALSLLREAVDHELGPDAESAMASAMATDPDLKSLHGDPRFAALVAHAKERATGAARKSN